MVTENLKCPGPSWNNLTELASENSDELLNEVTDNAEDVMELCDLYYQEYIHFRCIRP